MAAKVISRRARAKINLTLHVTGQRADGYHLLDSLVCFADISDELRVSAADELHLHVDGPMAAGVPTDESNLVMRAARMLDATGGADIHLTKYLPNAAGIGGGSADAAAALLGLAELWGVDLPETGLDRLGADVPVCLSPMALRMKGIGDQLDPIPPLPPLWAVLVNPLVAVETPVVFAALSEKTNAPMPAMPAFEDARELAVWCARQRNDLQTPAMGVAPVIQDVLDALQGTLLARMSGSGATCFGLCSSLHDARQKAAQITKDHPDWWVAASALS